MRYITRLYPRIFAFCAQMAQRRSSWFQFLSSFVPTGDAKKTEPPAAAVPAPLPAVVQQQPQQQQQQANVVKRQAQAQVQAPVPQVQGQAAKAQVQQPPQFLQRPQQVARPQTQAQAKAQAQAQVQSKAVVASVPPQQKTKSAKPKQVTRKLKADDALPPYKENSVQDMDLKQVAQLLKAPNVQEITIHYHHYVKVMDEYGVPHKVLKFVIKKDQLAAYVKQTFEDATTLRVLSGRVYLDAQAAAYDTLSTEIFIKILGWRAAKELTDISPLVKSIEVTRKIDSATLMLLSKTNDTIANLDKLYPLRIYLIIQLVLTFFNQIHQKFHVYNGINANSILYSIGGHTGIKFVIALARLLDASSGSAFQEPLLIQQHVIDKFKLDADEIKLIKDPKGPAKWMFLGSKTQKTQRYLSSPAQLDLIPFGILLLRIKQRIAEDSSDTSNVSVQDAHTMLDDVAARCFEEGATFDTSHNILKHFSQRYQVKMSSNAQQKRTWIVANSERQALVAADSKANANAKDMEAMSLDQVGAIRIAETLSRRQTNK